MSKHTGISTPDSVLDDGKGSSTPGLSKDDTITAVLEVNGYHRHDQVGDIEKVGYISEVTEAGEHKFHKLSWFQLVIVLVVAAVALGTLSMPV